MQIDTLVQGVESSDWLKLPGVDNASETDHLLNEVHEWISSLEEE